MSDQLLKAMLQPSNMVMITSRWPGGGWQVRNLTSGTTDLYPQLAWVDSNFDALQREASRMMSSEGAVASEVKIIRPTFSEVEFVCGGSRS